MTTTDKAESVINILVQCDGKKLVNFWTGAEDVEEAVDQLLGSLKQHKTINEAAKDNANDRKEAEAKVRETREFLAEKAQVIAEHMYDVMKDENASIDHRIRAAEFIAEASIPKAAEAEAMATETPAKAETPAEAWRLLKLYALANFTKSYPEDVAKLILNAGLYDKVKDMVCAKENW